MATTTYVPLISYTLPSNASTVTLGTGGQGTIPSTYTDLVLVAQVKTVTYNGVDINVRVGNGSIDTGANYSTTSLKGDGSSASSSRTSSATYFNVDNLSIMDTSEWTITTLHFQNYSNTTTYKTVLARTSKAGTGVSASVNLWRSTSAIDTIRFLCGADNYASGSTFTLYGIVNADTGALATGGVITYDSTYYYHTFGSSGTFTPKQNLSNVDYLVVGGGGGGGGTVGGGGGAGGIRSTVDATGGGGSLESKISLTSSTAYTITVGSGGTAASGNVAGGTGGSSSISGSGLTTITSNGGGGGGYYGNPNGVAAPSGTYGSGGGGGGGATGSGGAGASGTSTQGKNGGAGTAGSNTDYAGGGGGGGSTNGSDAVFGSSGTSQAGAGGTGVSIPNMANATGTGITTYYAGGGGGASGNLGIYKGIGGTGGGGNGGANSPALSGVNGSVNTGGGGGGARDYGAGTGGSGIVIIRYPKA